MAPFRDGLHKALSCEWNRQLPITRPSASLLAIHRVLAACAGICMVSAVGCGLLREPTTTDVVSYSTRPSEGLEINERAKALNEKGSVAFRNGQLAKAEAFFRDSLAEDVGFGPAHNNLGQIYLARHQLYLAAWEFEYAANLMPELPHPLIGQGLAYETAEQLDRAERHYRDAHERFPTHPLVLSSLTRVLIKQDSDPHEIGLLLDQLILHDSRQEWIEWAKELRMTRYRDDCELCFDGFTEYPSPPGPETTTPGQSFEPMGPEKAVDGLMEYDELEMLDPSSIFESAPEQIEPLPFELLEPQASQRARGGVRQVNYIPPGERPKRLPTTAKTQQSDVKPAKAIQFGKVTDTIIRAMK